MIAPTIIFKTKNLDERFYKRFIYTYLTSQIPKALRIQHKDKINSHVITIHPSTAVSNNPNFHGKKAGVGGATGINKSDWYLEDIQENIYDIVQRVFRQNAEVITHEMGHWFLLLQGLYHKVPLRNDDYGGVKKGTLANFYFAEVHDRDVEEYKTMMRFHFIDWKKFKIIRKQFRVLDFRDLLK